MNPSSQSGFWSPSEWYLAQVVHVLAGSAVMLAAHLHGWDTCTAALIFLVIAAFKEFMVDVSPFEGDSYFGSAQDWLCYAAGVGSGLLILDHFWWGVAGAGGTILLLFIVDLIRNADWSLPYD